MPGNNDRHADIFITGVESEEVEEINGAYEDLMLELGMVYKRNIFFLCEYVVVTYILRYE